MMPGTTSEKCLETKVEIRDDFPTLSENNNKEDTATDRVRYRRRLTTHTVSFAQRRLLRSVVSAEEKRTIDSADASVLQQRTYMGHASLSLDFQRQPCCCCFVVQLLTASTAS